MKVLQLNFRKYIRHLCVLAGACLLQTAGAQQAPIALTGWTDDVIVESDRVHFSGPVHELVLGHG